MTPHVITWPLLLVGSVIEVALVVSVMYVWREFGPSSSSDVAFARLANVSRRHLEKRSVWQQRCSVAYDARDQALDAFIAAARWQATGPRGGVWLLAASHPTSIALVAARYPDGPPMAKLLAIADSAAEVGEVGIHLC